MKESEEFNERINDPETWLVKLRERQKREMTELQRMRDKIKVRMILKEAEQGKKKEQTNKEKLRYKYERPRPVMFDSHKIAATEIFRTEQEQSPENELIQSE